MGRTMLSLINLQANYHVRQFRFDQDREAPSPDPTAKSFYPRPLLDLVEACLQPEPSNRINATELWLNIRTQVTDCKGLRDVPLKFQGLGEEEVLRIQPDTYIDWAK